MFFAFVELTILSQVAVATFPNMATSTKAHSTTKLHTPSQLSPAERETVAAVFQDCVDQLAVLGGIMPSNSKPSAVDAVSAIFTKSILSS